MNLHEHLRNARIEAGISQQELAERMQVYQKDISRWERGERTPSLEAFAKLCRKLHVSADIMLGLREE